MPDVPGAAPLLIFTTSFFVALSGAATPGPVLTVVIGQTLRRGFWAGPTIVAGHGFLELATVAVVALGIRLLDPQGPLVSIISLAGAAILFWTAWSLYQAARRASAVDLTSRQGSAPAGGWSSLLGMGIVVSLANPYWTIWWLTIGAAYALWSLQAALLGLAAFYAGHVLGDLAWYTAVSGLVARGRRFLSLRFYRGLLIACAVFLVALSAVFVWNGAHALAS